MKKIDSDRRPLTDHLSDLRSSIFRSIGSFLIGLLAFWSYADEIFEALFYRALLVLHDSKMEFVALSLMDRFWIPLKLSLAASLCFTLPVILYEAFRFLRPALKEKELKAIRCAFLAGPVLFLAGGSLWFFVALPQAVRFLLSMGPHDLRNILSLSEFIGFGLSMGLVFGGLFELPLLLLALMYTGVLSSNTLASRRKAAILVLAALSAIATPSPDAFSMVVLLVPLLVLFELTLLIGRLFERGRVEISHQ